MNTSFKVKKCGKYIELRYITLEKVQSYSLQYRQGVFHHNKAEVLNAISTIREFETLLDEAIKEQSLPFTTYLVILTHMEVIDGIASGLDIRSDRPRREVAERFLNNYKSKYNEAKEFCESALEQSKAEGESYMNNWQIYDKFNELNREFEFGYDELKTSTFQVDELGSLLDSSKQFLEELRKHNEQNG